VARFVEMIEKLYASMDASLRFRPPGTESPPPAAEPVPPPAPAGREADFRGVVCPLNYVKTKLALGQMQSGEILTMLLDEPGTRNVPDSVRKDGHQVVSITPTDGHWRVVIRKA
jgi:sulfite reductase (ferredoxin)